MASDAPPHGLAPVQAIPGARRAPAAARAPIAYFPVLEYHRIGEARADHVPTVTAAAFERQLRLLSRWGIRFLSADDAVAAMEQGRRPTRSTLITFDDGYVETATIAWPLLRRLGAPAIVFVTPGEVDTPGFATWEQLAAMALDGVTIGCHTMHHSYLPETPESRLEEELIAAKSVIEARIGLAAHYLSYPIGGYTPEAQTVARQAGYRAAFTTNRGISRSYDPFAIRRIKITERDRNPLVLWAKVSGFYDSFRRPKRPA
jgi:peptidoglycan/xylan/chitin deacetylase (PgdA/CDA1 family)